MSKSEDSTFQCISVYNVLLTAVHFILAPCHQLAQVKFELRIDLDRKNRVQFLRVGMNYIFSQFLIMLDHILQHFIYDVAAMQAWAILEEKLGHLSEARKLFDAATAADIKHAAAWHGWAVLELRQGSIRKARELLSKGLKYSGGNEYLYQTSALIEYRTGNVELARALFSQAIFYNPNSCASWLVRISSSHP
jgi:tetratricopeptide (TPR) repeat protein